MVVSAMDQDEAPAKRRKRNRGRSCFGCCCCGLPLVLFASLAVIITMHSRPSRITLPVRVLPPHNAYDDFVKAGNLATAMAHKSPYSMRGPASLTHTLANFAACAKDAQPAHAVLRQGLPLPYMNPRDRSNLDATHITSARFRELARTLAGEADYYALTGQYARAVDSCLDCMEYGVMLPHGEALTGGWIGLTCEASGASKLEPLLPHLSEPELAHVADRLDRITAKRVPFAEIALEEGYTDVAIMQKILNKMSSLKILNERTPVGEEKWQTLAAAL